MDGDGLSNLEEDIAGTEPTSGSSYLKVEHIRAPNGVPAVEFVALSNKTYTVQWKESLSAGRWSKMGDVGGGSSNRMERVLDPYPQSEGRRNGW